MSTAATARWVQRMFQSAQAAQGGVVRRDRRNVQKFASLAEVISEAKKRGFHVIETGGQIVVLCHKGSIIIHA